MPKKYLFNNSIENSNNNSGNKSQTKKTSSKSKSKTCKSKKKMQKGGLAPYDNQNQSNLNKYFKSSCHSANIHNTQNKMNDELISGVGVLPSGQSGGAVRSGTVVQNLPVHKMEGGSVKKSKSKSKSGKTKSGKSKSGKSKSGKSKNKSVNQKGGFNNYINKVSDALNRYTDENVEIEHQLSQVDSQGGGGYSVNPEESVAGLPVVNGYDDCCPPAINYGKLTTNFASKPVCGSGAQKGGKRKTKRSNKKTKSSNNSSKSPNRKQSKGRKTMKKTGIKTKNNNSNQKGGSKTGNIPGNFPDSFDTPISDFTTAENPELTWNGKQPYWDPKTR